MPQIDPGELAGKLEAEEVITLFTVENLADMVKCPACATVLAAAARAVRVGVDLVAVARLRAAASADDARAPAERLFTERRAGATAAASAAVRAPGRAASPPRRPC